MNNLFPNNGFNTQNSNQNPFYGYSGNQLGNLLNGYSNIIKVSGIDEVKAYSMAANSNIVFFNSNEDIFYLKSTDNNNYPSIRIFDFSERIEQPAERPRVAIDDNEKWVTIDQFEQFKEELLNGKYNISTGTAESTGGRELTTNSINNEDAKSKPKSSTNVTKSSGSKSTI